MRKQLKMRKRGRAGGGECVEKKGVRGDLCSGEAMKQYTTDTPQSASFCVSDTK